MSAEMPAMAAAATVPESGEAAVTTPTQEAGMYGAAAAAPAASGAYGAAATQELGVSAEMPAMAAAAPESGEAAAPGTVTCELPAMAEGTYEAFTGAPEPVTDETATAAMQEAAADETTEATPEAAANETTAAAAATAGEAAQPETASGEAAAATPESSTPESGEAPKEEKSEEKKKKKLLRKHILFLIMALIVVCILVVVIVLAVRSENSPEEPEVNFMDQIRNQEIKENDAPLLQEFFEEYYDALATGKTTKLEQMYDDPSMVNITTEISSIVDSYDNLKIYQTPGIDENTIVAFVYNDIHFTGIDTVAPSVDSFYLWFDPDLVSLEIDSLMYTDPDILKFMNLVSYREPIRSLLEDTNESLNEVLSGNKDLNNLYILMQSMAEAIVIPEEDDILSDDEDTEITEEIGEESAENITAEDTTKKDTTAEDTTKNDTTEEDTTAEDNTPADDNGAANNISDEG